MNIRSYINENRTRFIEEWASLIRIPSVSCQPAHKDDMLRCAERWKELLLEAGVQRAEIMPSEGNPFVYAEYSPLANSPYPNCPRLFSLRCDASGAIGLVAFQSMGASYS